VRRGGELLQQVKKAQSGDPQKLKSRQRPNSRKATAKAAGLSPDQTKQMLRVWLLVVVRAPGQHTAR